MEDDQLEYMISTLKTSGIGEKAFLCPSHLGKFLVLIR